jgi:hypothetical protein
MKLPDSNRAAFTLLEVMIAVGIFFMAMFTILGVLSGSLHAASILRNSGPTAGMVAAQWSITNKLEEGSVSGNFGEIYEGYRWIGQISEASTNGLFQMDIEVINPNGMPDSTLAVLFYRPDSMSQTGLH